MSSIFVKPRAILIGIARVLVNLPRIFFCWSYKEATELDIMGDRTDPKTKNGVGEIDETPKVKYAQLVVTQAWGRRKGGKPGRGTKILADVALDLYMRYQLKVFPHAEISAIWMAAIPNIDLRAGIAGGLSDGFSVFEWNSYKIAKQQADYCERTILPNLRSPDKFRRGKPRAKVVVVDHPLKMWRSLRVYEKLGLESIAAPVPKRWRDYDDPELANPWHRIWWRAVLWEILARIYFFYKGYI